MAWRIRLWLLGVALSAGCGEGVANLSEGQLASGESELGTAGLRGEYFDNMNFTPRQPAAPPVRKLT